jgi:hypothetical protein
MGADFVFAAVELPPGDLDLESLCAKARQIALTDSETQDRLREILCPLADASSEEMAEDLGNILREVLQGEYARCLGELSTYNKDGEPIVLTISGCMSWGDVEEATEALWTIDCLPERWWK